MRWFVGLGPRPRFGRYTYWEKFDYWAVFWGMGIIGGSGLLLWFPRFFALLVPGWFFNLALLIHGEEALLAVGFIFTVHFFNSHIRPSKFPMDTVIFTGRVSDEELCRERPAEYDRLRDTGQLDRLVVEPPPAWVMPLARATAVAVLTIGFAVVIAIVLTLLQSGL